MYEGQTFEIILNRMLDRVPDGVDKREGSIIYDALAPAAVEMAQMYIELDVNANLKFADTASGEYLDRAVAWSGISRKAATKARWAGSFRDNEGKPVEVPLESRFSTGDRVYVVVERIAAGQYVLECEVAGAEGNEYTGALLPIDYIAGLTTAELTQLLVHGEDEETDQALYDRYQDKVSRPVTSANKYQYELWARENSGVGKAKAFPLWDGPGTVKVALLNNEMQTPADAVIKAVQEYIDPTQNGMGEGAAPIGPVVTVVGAEEVPIDVEVQVTLASGSTYEGVKTLIETGVTAYLKELAFADPLVRWTRIANVILDIPPVIDYSDLLVNGGMSNLEIAPGAVAVLGTVKVT
ncbi:baseplate J/gp47 family protein [Paenibacillus sp. FSL R5-0749]|uniref:baseplate J/gp47 family protein n=1 Tax=Paenibacillus sp. FSL R5-0749 TaxID=2921657 RepID=UPI00315A427C